MKRSSTRSRLKSKLSERSFWRHLGSRMMLWIILSGIMYVMIYPLLQIISTSLKTYEDMINPTVVWIGHSFAIGNFSQAYTAMDITTGLINTCKIVFTAPLLQLVSCSLAGYGFARFKFKEKNLLFTLMLFSMLVPHQVICLPQFLLFKKVNMLNTYLPLIVPAIFGQGLKSALFVYIFRQFFRGLPKELEDAAYIDGCGFFHTYVRIMLPNAVPAALTVFLFSFVWHFSDVYYVSTFVTRPALATLPIRLINIMGYLVKPGVAKDPLHYVPIKYAGILLVILPMMLVYLFGQKYFVEGVERSGIVG